MSIIFESFIYPNDVFLQDSLLCSHISFFVRDFIALIRETFLFEALFLNHKLSQDHLHFLFDQTQALRIFLNDFFTEGSFLFEDQIVFFKENESII